MSSNKVWWYAKGDQRQGPFTAAELKALVASGQVAPTDMVWKEGLANWVPASSVNGLFTSSGSEAPPPLPSTGSSTHGGPAPKRKVHGALKAVLWVVGVFVALIILVAIFGPSDNNSTGTAQVASTSPNGPEATAAPVSKPEPPPLKVGDTFETPTFQMQIVSAQLRSSVGDSMFYSQASKGGVYVAIQWIYKNISKKPVGAFDLPSLHLIAPDGTKYDPDLGASSSYATELNTNAKVLSDLNPGIQVTDVEVFEVSQEQFDPASWRILIDADQPIKVDFAATQDDARPN